MLSFALRKMSACTSLCHHLFKTFTWQALATYIMSYLSDYLSQRWRSDIVTEPQGGGGQVCHSPLIPPLSHAPSLRLSLTSPHDTPLSFLRLSLLPLYLLHPFNPSLLPVCLLAALAAALLHRQIYKLIHKVLRGCQTRGVSSTYHQ